MSRPTNPKTVAAFLAAAHKLAKHLEKTEGEPELADRLLGFAGAMVGESSHDGADQALGARTARELGLALYFAEND